jgi:hypothetical protein
MKNLLKKIALLSVVMLVFGCSKDSPTSNTAACTPIPCLNGGTSTSNCGCICPQGFTGSNCGTQITPSQILITKVKVSAFPSTTTNGNFWDATAVGNYVRPDIFPYLTLGSTALLQGTAVQDAVNTSVYTWTPTTPVVLTQSQISSQYTLSLYDEDSLTNEFMGGWNFYIYNSTGGFPTTKTVGAAGPVTFELTLSYVW